MKRARGGTLTLRCTRILVELSLMVINCRRVAWAFFFSARTCLDGRRVCSRGTSLRAVASPVEPREDPWEVLGISRSADRSEVKAQFHRLVRIYHPDLSPGGSPYMMQRLIRAADAILDTTPQRTPPAPTPQRHHMSRYEKIKQKRAKSQAAQDLKDAVVYAGRSRVRRSVWSEYRITMGKIEIFWKLGPYVCSRGVQAHKIVQFQEVRRIRNRVDLQDGRCDVELELVWGTRLVLEQLPQEVAAHVIQFVTTARQRQEAKRARILDRRVTKP
uniref:J domain-containing protein n=1 Tax=Pyrodinium bahamense TaxID=73915 RepID=A0A7R9ZWS0_9DINO|mmetsp:Transcript_13139/g.36306  ORF Transcript_13139/g.36306 Transcript_13139/m.36306 type:complete len:273 (+) Transcript_13139:1-819(+)